MDSGKFARMPGLHPYSFEGHPGIFNDHGESIPRFNVSSEGWCPHYYTGALGPTQTTGLAPPTGLSNTSFQQPSGFLRRSPIQVLTRLNPA